MIYVEENTLVNNVKVHTKNIVSMLFLILFNNSVSVNVSIKSLVNLNVP